MNFAIILSFMRVCIGGHLLKPCGGHLLRLCRGHFSRVRVSWSATHSAKCQVLRKMPYAWYVFYWKKMWKFESNRKRFLWIYFIVFWKYHGILSIYIVYKYVSILVYEKPVYLLSFVLIIVYCDSIFRSQDLFVMSEEKT